MTKKKDLRCYPDLTLTISKFMSTFYNIKEKNLNRLSHNDLKEIFPILEQAKKEYSTEEDLVRGEVVLVIDCDNKGIGYYNPYVYDYEHYEKTCHDNDNIHFIFTVDDDIDVLESLSEEELNNLSIYELENLLKKAKKHQKLKEQRLVQKELYFDKENHSMKKEKQEKARIRELRKEDL